MTLPLLPQPTVTAPDWRDNPYAWCEWYLDNNTHIYHTFRDEVDRRLDRYPLARVSADAVLHHIRWITPINAKGDLFAVNNNAAPLFARLYILERPMRRDNFELRRSMLDDFSADDLWKLVLKTRWVPYYSQDENGRTIRHKLTPKGN